MSGWRFLIPMRAFHPPRKKPESINKKSIEILRTDEWDNLNDGHGVVRVIEKLLSEINREAATVVAVHLHGNLSHSISHRILTEKEELPEERSR